MSNLVQGKTVSLKVKNILWPARDRYANGVITNEFNFYEGEVRYEKWFKPNQVGLTTGDPRFPMRVIELERIVEIDGVERSKSSEQSLQISNGGEGLRRTVKGSRGALYEVEIGGRRGSSCSCPGYQFRGNCRHIKEVSEAESVAA